ncbi:hypothetical protein [Nonomuraea roseoviolacea]|uniref:Uncharacterized protein n=1 Tax=Nonomuraea roseoviolacea subsp. carminata TaxID=160689 RepID=A0ABT1K1A6_9ACTN|nr:hypothetical protein [Nonomuraea roseoviolacea]MCP2347768.1 hypothetical protein [Nonomuraea roseoviolacea subsp. carminata]
MPGTRSRLGAEPWALRARALLRAFPKLGISARAQLRDLDLD